MKSFLLILLVISFVAFPAAVKAGDGSPWSEVLNPDGSVQWDKLTDLGTTSEPAPWMSVGLPGGINLNLDATYQRYQTPSGNIIVVPSPLTLFFMAQHPEESGLNDAQSMLGNGAAMLAMLAGGAMTPDQLADLAAKGYTDPKQFFQAVIDGKENIWSVLNLTFLFELVKMSTDANFIVNALLMYVNGAANCASIPGGCSGVVNKPDNPPDEVQCPAPTIAQKPADLMIQKTAPAKPLVIGQDPNKRGADLQIAVTIPPVIFTWYEEVRDKPACEFSGDGTGEGCAGPGDQYKKVKDESGSEISWGDYMENNHSWKVVPGDVKCIKHVETLPESITSVQAAASLSAESRYWILNDLAGKYYQAYVHRDTFNLVPGLGTTSSGCSGDGVCSASALVLNVPFADPGTFNLKLTVYTSGTVLHWKDLALPITQPRVLYKDGSIQVYVTLTSLMPAGAP